MQRDIYQVEQFSQYLATKSKSRQTDPTSSYNDASRLLATEGLNPRQYSLALQNFQVMPTYEEEQQQHADVQTYVEQVHNALSSKAIQVAHENAISSFEKHIDAYLDSTWQREKKALFDTGDPYAAGLHGGRQQVASPAPLAAARFSAAPSPAHLTNTHVLRGKAAKYAEVVKEMNKAISTGTKLDSAVGSFANACKVGSLTNKDAVGTTMLRLWTISEKMLAKVADIPASASLQKTMLMIDGTRSYLEENFHAHMASVVQSHRTVAALGGYPDKARLVEAYLRVKESKLRESLDFDSPGGLDTVWARIYFCVRSGFIAEAREIIRLKVKNDHTTTAGEWIEAWLEGGCKPLAGEQAAAALAESERLLASGGGVVGHIPRSPSPSPSAAGSPPTELRSCYIAAVCALAAGSSRCADCLSRDYPGFFPTIEDYMWFRLTLVRVDAMTSAAAAATPQQQQSSRANAPYTLPDFQAQINQYSAEHYSKGGQEPLLYAAVLLMSLQAEKAVEYLATDPATHEFRVDAVHFAICFWYHRAIAPHESSISATSVHQYAHQLIHRDIGLALEYYIVAALVMGGSTHRKGKLLKELLTESHEYGVLLGSGSAVSDGGALSRFFPDRASRLEILESIAQECASDAQFEEAVELFMVAEQPVQALNLLNNRIAEAIDSSSMDLDSDPAIAELCSRAESAAAEIHTRDETSEMEKETYRQLQFIRKIIYRSRRGDSPGVLEVLWDLSFIPTDRQRVQPCVNSLRGAHPAVIGLIQPVLLAGGEALTRLNKPEQLHVLVSFAAAIPDRISQHAYQKLSEYQTYLG